MKTKAELTKNVLESGDALIDGHTHIGVDISAYINGEYPYGITSEDHVVRMNATGIGFAATFPLVYSRFFELKGYREKEFRRDPESGLSAPYEWENERMMQELCIDFPEFQHRFLPFAFFDPARRQSEQVKCIRALAREYPVFGLKTVSTYIQSPILDLLGDGECLLDLAAEMDFPIIIHSSILPSDIWAQVHDILKIVEARPEIRFTLAHTCRFDRRGLDRAAELPNCFVDTGAFHIHCHLAVQNSPSVAVEKDRFPANYSNHAEALQQVAEAYPGKITWGSDIPAHYWKYKSRLENGEWKRAELRCGPTTETDELHKLPSDIKYEIARHNFLRFLLG